MPLALPRPIATALYDEDSYDTDVEQWRPLVSKYFKPEDVDKALYVIEGESGGNARAANPESSARGLLQMTDVHGVPEETRYDPEESIRWAADRVYRSRGDWGDWGEGVLSEGKPFGILGLKPYQGGGSTPSAPSGGGAGILRSIGGFASGGDDAELTRARRRIAQETVEETRRAGVRLPGAEDYMSGQEEILAAADTSSSGEPRYGDDYVDAPTGSLRARLEASRQGESQYGRIPEVIAKKPLDVATLAAYPFAPGWLATDVAAEKAGELAGGGIPGAAASLATGIAGPAAVSRSVRGLLRTGAGNADEMLSIIGKEASDPVANYQKLRAAGFEDKDIAKAFGDDAVRLGKGDVTREAVTEAAEDARGLEQAGNKEKYRPTKRGGNLASRVREIAERLGGDGPVASAVRRGDQFTDAAAAERRAAGAAEKAEVAAHQARVEASTLARNREDWLKTRDEALETAAAKAPKEGIDPLREVLGVIGLSRTLPTSGDAGGIMRNTAVLGASRPKVWWDTAGKQLKAAFSEADAQTFQRAVEDSPNYSNAVERWGWHVNDWGPNAKMRVPERSGQLENARIAKTVLNLPGVKQLQEGSERSLAIGRNVLGGSVIDEYADFFRKALDVPPTQLIPPPEMDKQMSGIARVVNHANGWSELAGGKDPFGVFFSLPYTFSRFQIIADPLVEAMRGNPEASKLALRNLVNFAGANASLLGMLAITGERTGNWSVNFNPTDGDFGQLKVGNTRFDTLAGMGPIIKTASRLGANVEEGDWVNLLPDFMRFFENKETPFFKAFTDLWVRRQLPGVDNARDAVMPMMVSSLIDAFKEGENPFIMGAGAVASSVGIGANTYETPEDKANTTAQERYGGRKLDELAPLERLTVLDPLDKSRNGPRSQARDSYEAERKKAGYAEPEPKPTGRVETKAEEAAREARNKPINARNAEVYKNNPELDVQKWYFGGGTTLGSLDAVDKAVELGIPERVVKYNGADRDLAASDDDRAAWRKYGEIIDYVQAQLPNDKAYLQQLTQFKNKDWQLGGKTYEQLADKDKKRIQGFAREQARRAPATEALMIFMGVESPTDGEYSMSSTQVYAELQKLWDEFPDAAPLPKPRTTVVYAKNAR